MLKHDIPLNQVILFDKKNLKKLNYLFLLKGCLSPIQVVIPKGSILWPHEGLYKYLHILK